MAECSVWKVAVRRIWGIFRKRSRGRPFASDRVWEGGKERKSAGRRIGLIATAYGPKLRAPTYEIPKVPE